MRMSPLENHEVRESLRTLPVSELASRFGHCSPPQADVLRGGEQMPFVDLENALVRIHFAPCGFRHEFLATQRIQLRVLECRQRLCNAGCGHQGICNDTAYEKNGASIPGENEKNAAATLEYAIAFLGAFGRDMSTQLSTLQQAVQELSDLDTWALSEYRRDGEQAKSRVIAKQKEQADIILGVRDAVLPELQEIGRALENGQLPETNAGFPDTTDWRNARRQAL